MAEGDIVSVILDSNHLDFTFADNAQKEVFDNLGDNWIPSTFVSIFFVASIPHIDGKYYVKKGMSIFDISFTVKSNQFLGSTTFHFKIHSPANGYLVNHHNSMIAKYGDEMFSIELHENIDELFDIAKQIKDAEKAKAEKTDNEECYVYLMEDTSNGYHKIGISNHPHYREHTLQSEKPTIELLFTKLFPNRKMAEAIESTLHKVYSKQRIRGEWFNLTQSDIDEIKQTLS